MYPTIFTSAACRRAGESGAGVGRSRGTEQAPRRGVLYVAVESYDLAQQVSQPTIAPKNNFDPGEKR